MKNSSEQKDELVLTPREQEILKEIEAKQERDRREGSRRAVQIVAQRSLRRACEEGGCEDDGYVRSLHMMAEGKFTTQEEIDEMRVRVKAMDFGPEDKSKEEEPKFSIRQFWRDLMRVLNSSIGS